MRSFALDDYAIIVAQRHSLVLYISDIMPGMSCGSAAVYAA